MDENKEEKGWDDLLKDLGAEPDEAAFERHQPESREIPPTEIDEDTIEAQFAGKTSDWRGLAESLGLEVPDEPEPEVVAPAPTEQAAKPVAPRRSEKPSARETAARSDSVDNEFHPEEDDEIDVGDSFAGELALELPPTAEEEAEQETLDAEPEAAEPDELPPLQSTVERAMSEDAWSEEDEAADSERAEAGESAVRGISGEAARSAFDALFSDGASAWGSAFLQPSEGEALPTADKAFEEELAMLRETGGTAADEESEEEDKPKRSRRRRRGGRGRKRAEERVADESLEEEPDLQGEEDEADEERPKKRRRRRPRKSRAETPGEAEDSVDDDLDVDDDDDVRQPTARRQRHRNIPSWSEAIGMIVDSNLQQREQAPAKTQSSRRRGGRGRRGKKPENG